MGDLEGCVQRSLACELPLTWLPLEVVGAQSDWKIEWQGTLWEWQTDWCWDAGHGKEESAPQVQLVAWEEAEGDLQVVPPLLGQLLALQD